jgi:hypothetical protein
MSALSIGKRKNQMTTEELVHHILRIWCQYDLDHADLLWVVQGTADEACFSVDCSDLFAWGEADSEPITADNVDLLEQMVRDNSPADSDRVLQLWCAIQRNERPMPLRLEGAPAWVRAEVDTRWPLAHE